MRQIITKDEAKRLLKTDRLGPRWRTRALKIFREKMRRTAPVKGLSRTSK